MTVPESTPQDDDAAWDGVEAFADEAREIAEAPFLYAEQLRGERDTARNRVAALEKNGAKLLERAETAEAEVYRLLPLTAQTHAPQAPLFRRVLARLLGVS